VSVAIEVALTRLHSANSCSVIVRSLYVGAGGSVVVKDAESAVVI
jgi:hypothetical protein